MKNKLFFIYAITLAMFSISNVCYSYNTEVCDGKVVGAQSSVTYKLMRCSISVGGSRESDAVYGLEAWDVPIGILDRFSVTDGTSSCIDINHSNEQNEYAYGLYSELDNHLGVNYNTVYPCVWPYTSFLDGHLRETDIMIAGDVTMDTGQINGCSAFTGDKRRVLTTHEAGHTLGANHYNSGLSVMNSIVTAATYCGTDAVGILADDIHFAQTYHGSSSNSWDAAPSAYVWGGSAAILTTAPGVYEVCPGWGVSYRFTVDNRGTYDFTGTNILHEKTVLSTDTTITNSDVAVQYINFSLYHATTYTTGWKTFTVPSGLIAGQEYWIGIITDYDNRFSEFSESNNATYLAGKIKIKTNC